MCDTLCVVGRERTLFAKNSDRPVDEVQLIQAFARRPPGPSLRTQYLELDDPGAAALVGSRPEWLWGLEHGVNEHGVAIGNEKVFTRDDPYAAEPALIGMDLVRLGLERSRSADEALGVITALLEEHGQGGIADQSANEPYWSSFLVADSRGAWILETSERSWAAKAVDDSAAISNRLVLSRDWTRASADVPPASDWDAWRHPDAPTGHADRRLDATRACVAAGATSLAPRDLVATMRHHGTRPWGAPGGDPADVDPPPPGATPDGTGVTVCMHIRGYQATAASLVAELPADPGSPLRAWMAPGNPCVSVYVPVFPPRHVPPELANTDLWRRVAKLRERADADPDALVEIRAALAPLETELWEEADAIAGDPTSWPGFTATAGRRFEDAVTAIS